MNIEVIEFYPLDRDEDRDILTGTLRIKLIDLGIHILGVFVSKRKDSWYFAIPGRNAIHYKTGEPLRYPCIVFDDREKQAALMESIRLQGRAFIERRLADAQDPLIFSTMKEKIRRRAAPPKECTNATAAKETVSIAKSEPVTAATIKRKTWVTPPKRNYENHRGR